MPLSDGNEELREDVVCHLTNFIPTLRKWAGSSGHMIWSKVNINLFSTEPFADKFFSHVATQAAITGKGLKFLLMIEGLFSSI